MGERDGVSFRHRLLLVCGLSAVAIGTILTKLLDTGGNGEVFAFALGGLLFLSVASLLVMRVPGNRLSWLLLAVSFGITLTAFAGSAGDSTGDMLGGFGLFGLVLPGLGVFVPLWFPTGAPPTPRWRWVGWMAVLGASGMVLGLVLAIYAEGGDSDVDSCSSIGSCSKVAGLILILVAIVFAIAALVVRWVRSEGVERLQMKWLVLAFLVFGIGAVAEFGSFQYSVVANLFLPAGVALIPITIGIAVLRYRLYEIDRILSRTVSYTLLITLLAAAFFGAVTLLTSVLSSDSDLVTAAATLLVAGLFNPLRRRVQAAVDRRFNRSRYDTQRVMDRFAGSLRNQLDSHQVMTGWVAVVNETMQPAAVGVWIREAGA